MQVSEVSPVIPTDKLKFPMEKIKNIKTKFRKNVLLGYLNINSIRNKIESLFSLIEDYFDVFCIAETKIDCSFPNAQFLIKGYKIPIRLDITDKSGGLLVYVKQGLSSIHLTEFSLPTDIQIIPIELRLNSVKWLIISIYRPPKQNINYFLSWLSDVIDLYNSERCIIIGDFNIDPQNKQMLSFMNSQIFHNHVNFKTCFKTTEGSCIDLILSNKKHCLQFTDSLDIGLSDYHRLIYTMLRSTFSKAPPKEICYRDYKNFSEEKFLDDLVENFQDDRNSIALNDYNYFEEEFTNILNKHAPLKRKIIRGNKKPHMNKTLKKAIMKRTMLRNKYRKSKSVEDLYAYKIQRNLVTKLNKQSKENHFREAIKMPNCNHKDFWKLFKPFLSNKCSVRNEIILSENDNIIVDEEEIATLLNNHFNCVTKHLNLFTWNIDYKVCSYKHPVINAIDKFKDHPSIIKIRETVCCMQPFKFRPISTNEVFKMILNLDCKKKTSGPIPNKILKQSVHIISPILRNIINKTFDSGLFPDKLKLAEITPVPKYCNSKNVGDFRPISILPSVSKLIEKAMADQLEKYFEAIFSNLLCGFRKRYSTQHALLQLLRSWQKSLDDGNIVGTILMDLSKAYDCLPHDLLIAKIAAYQVDFKSLCLIQSYLSNRFHRVKIGAKFSNWLENQLGVPQGSILGPIFFNIFINDLLLFICDANICNFADDNSIYAAGKDQQEVISILQKEISNVLYWFKVNSMAANPDKFQLMFLGKNKDNIAKISFENIILQPTNCVKLLGISIDSKLNFESHVQALCKNASNKIKALFRIRPYLDIYSAKRICDIFILSIFNYCPLIWMYGCKSNDKLINKTHKRALMAVHKDYKLSFEELLQKDDSVFIYVRNLRFLLIEIYKSINGENPSFLWNMFRVKNSKYSRSGETL